MSSHSHVGTPLRYAGVLPYAIHNGVRYYLIGKEHKERGWSGSEKWSDFGGDPENETPLRGAAREFYEETMGFFGTITDIVALLKKGERQAVPGGYTYLIKLKYDPLLPGMFQRVHRYFLQCASVHKYKRGYMSIPSCPSGLFEKTDIKWISEAELRRIATARTRKVDYRPQFLTSLQVIFAVDLPQRGRRAVKTSRKASHT